MTNLKNLALVTMIFAALVIGCKPPANDNSKPASEPAASKPSTDLPIAIDAKSLTKAYDENELAADGKFKGKMVVVTGKISNIAETLGNVTVSLEGHNMIVDVVCSFPESEKAAVAKLKKGGQASFMGTVTGSTAGLYVEMEKCRFP